MGGRVRQLRLVVEAEDFDEAVAFYRDTLGLDVELDLESEGGAHVVILDAGRATLEISNPAQVDLIDRVEVGRRVSPRMRVAFEVDDAEATAALLADAGAEVIAPTTRTPWDSLNARLAGPAGLQLTVFQELGRAPVETSWNALLLDQLEWQWEQGLRPRLEGLTDKEYFWEPAAGSWSVRRRGEPAGAQQVGDGEWAIDFTHPEPEPAPITTIAWRLNHLASMFAIRAASHVGRDPVDYDSFPYAGSADEAVARLAEERRTWVEGVQARGEDGLLRPCGPAEGPFAADPFAALVLHLNREFLHHGAEICLLRDLYRAGVGVGRA